MRLRIRVVHPPPGVTLRLQRGREDLVVPVSQTAGDVTFEFDVRVGSRPGGLLNFLGEFTQGPPAARFVYLNWGRMAGQLHSTWSRRAKVPLTAIDRTLVDKAVKALGVLTVDIDGTGRDGGPVSGTVRLLEGAWRLEAS